MIGGVGCYAEFFNTAGRRHHGWSAPVRSVIFSRRLVAIQSRDRSTGATNFTLLFGSRPTLRLPYGLMKLSKLRLQATVAVILAFASTLSAQSSFTLNQIMGSPFPSQLVAATHTNRVAWVFDAKGVRNVWVADGPDFARTARPVTRYQADDGQPIASLQLTPDGKTVLYEVGSELNDAQESANPESWTKGVKQQVFALDVDQKQATPRLLGEMGCPDEGC